MKLSTKFVLIFLFYTLFPFGVVTADNSGISSIEQECRGDEKCAELRALMIEANNALLGQMIFDHPNISEPQKSEVFTQYKKIGDKLTYLCDSGVGEGCYKLGNLLLNGKGFESSILDAILVYTKGCKLGHTGACYGVGIQLLNSKDKSLEERSREFFRLGCYETVESKETFSSCNKLAQIYMEGIGVQIDDNKSVELLKKACNNGKGEKQSCRVLGTYHNNGYILEQDYSKAASYFKKGCISYEDILTYKMLGGVYPSMINSLSCKKLSGLYKFGHGVKQDKYFEEYYKKIAQNIALNDKEAARLFEKSCKSGNIEGCENMGLLYTLSPEVKRDYGKVTQSSEIGCGFGDVESCYWFGVSNWGGEGIRVNHSKGKKLIFKACSDGLKQACKDLKSINTLGYISID